MNTLKLMNTRMNVAYSIKGGTQSDAAKLKRAIDMLQIVINSPLFRHEILDYKTVAHGGFAQTNESSHRILERFVEGAERGSEIDNEIDLHLFFYINRWGRAIAYTTKGSIEINLNKKYFGTRGIAELANTLIHEYCHLVGMTHSYRNPGWSIWNHTAPYAIGNLVEKAVLSILGEAPISYAKQPSTSVWRRFKTSVWNVFH